MSQIILKLFQVLSITFVINIYVSGNPGVERVLLQTKTTVVRSNTSAVPLSDLDTGKCWTEVLTASLIKNYNNNIPRGNSSNPAFSIVQACCEGYQSKPDNSSICEPVCNDKCNNGHCVAPDTCKCIAGYVQNLGGFCIPTCPTACPHGYCDHTGVCKCSSAYQLDPTGKYCIPKCLRDCGPNANCTQPGSCECLPGFKLSTSQMCEPFCYPDCGNGRCVAPGKCECKPHFTVIDNICQANCPRGCLGGRCVAPNVCQCESNYTLNEEGNVCEAKCNGSCENGHCLQPNVCSCHQGYYMSLSTNKCTPVCNKCRFGTCTKPGVCECPEGWSPDKSGLDCDKRVWLRMCPYDHKVENGKCIPHCVGGCQNGACVAPHTCKCNEGYQLEENVCIKIALKNSTTAFSNREETYFENKNSESVYTEYVSTQRQDRTTIAKGSYFNTEKPNRAQSMHAEPPIYSVAEDVYQVDSIPASNYPRQYEPNAPYNREYRQSHQDYQQQQQSVNPARSEEYRVTSRPEANYQQRYTSVDSQRQSSQQSYEQQPAYSNRYQEQRRSEEYHTTSRPEPHYQQHSTSVDSQRQSSHQSYQEPPIYANSYQEQGRSENYHTTSRPELQYYKRYTSTDPERQSAQQNYQQQPTYTNNYEEQRRSEEYHTTSRPEQNYHQRYTSVDSERQSAQQNYHQQSTYSNGYQEQGRYQSSQQERPASNPTYVDYSGRSENPSRSYPEETTPSYQYNYHTTENRQEGQSSRSQSNPQYNQREQNHRQDRPEYVPYQEHHDHRLDREYQEPRGPVCEPICVNGECTDRNTCDCNIGYRPRSDAQNYCEPICYECQQDLCISPYNCACPAGYRKNEEGRCDRLY